MAGGADHDDARGRAGAQPIQQQVGQEKRAQVVDREGGLQAVFGEGSGHRDGAGVVDEHVEAFIPGQEGLGQGADLALRGEIAQE